MKKETLTVGVPVLLLALSVFFTGFKSINSVQFAPNKNINILEEGMGAFLAPYGDWKVENSQLILPVKNGRDNRTNIWLQKDYGDFVLELDFKVDDGTNSGVFFRTANMEDPVQTGIEVQIRDDYANKPIDKNFCGSIYDIKEVSDNRVKKPGEWNHLKISCKGSKIKVFLNKGKVIDIDLDEWDEAGENPDGTENKFKTAYKEMARDGKIGFQDHGGKVWYRKIRIKEL